MLCMIHILQKQTFWILSLRNLKYQGLSFNSSLFFCGKQEYEKILFVISLSSTQRSFNFLSFYNQSLRLQYTVSPKQGQVQVIPSISSVSCVSAGTLLAGTRGLGMAGRHSFVFDVLLITCSIPSHIAYYWISFFLRIVIQRVGWRSTKDISLMFIIDLIVFRSFSFKYV